MPWMISLVLLGSSLTWLSIRCSLKPPPGTVHFSLIDHMYDASQRLSLHQKPKWQSVFRFPLCTGRSCKLYLSHPGPQATSSVLMIIRFELAPTTLQVCKALFQLSCHQLSPLTVDPGRPKSCACSTCFPHLPPFVRFLPTPPIPVVTFNLGFEDRQRCRLSRGVQSVPPRP